MTLSDNKHPRALHNIWASVRAYLSAGIEEVFTISWAAFRTTLTTPRLVRSNMRTSAL
jgi:hypothetical protein